jgi:hypothetical protein
MSVRTTNGPQSRPNLTRPDRSRGSVPQASDLRVSAQSPGRRTTGYVRCVPLLIGGLLVRVQSREPMLTSYDVGPGFAGGLGVR